MSAPTVQSFRNIIGIQPSTPTTSDSVLIIIDAQNEYLHGRLKVDDVETSAKGIEVLLEKYRSRNGSIVHVVHEVPQGAPVFTPGTQLPEIFESLAPREGEKIVTKNYPSSFAKTELDGYLKGLGKNKIVLCGYMAHVCVSTTARAGSELGYDVTVVSDAVGDRTVPGATGATLVQVVLAELGDAFATVTSTTNIH